MADTFTPEQITQILEEFFKVVGTRKYIGERYVPIFGRKGEESIQWDNSAPYEPLTIVLYQGNSYTSRQYVPIGVEITNQEFWVITGNYNAQVEAYHRETIAAREIADNAITTANAAQTDIDTLLPKADFSAENTVKKYIDENLTRILTFDTVADMQAATMLKSGMVCHTNGFHASGDGGAAYYTVSESGTANGMDVLALQNELYAALVITEPYVTPEMFGAYGDGTHNDTAALQYAVSNYRIVRGIHSYLITSINIGSYRTIELNKLMSDTIDTAVHINGYYSNITITEVRVTAGNGFVFGDSSRTTNIYLYCKDMSTYKRCITIDASSYSISGVHLQGRFMSGSTSDTVIYIYNSLANSYANDIFIENAFVGNASASIPALIAKKTAGEMQIWCISSDFESSAGIVLDYVDIFRMSQCRCNELFAKQNWLTVKNMDIYRSIWFVDCQGTCRAAYINFDNATCEVYLYNTFTRTPNGAVFRDCRVSYRGWLIPQEPLQGYGPGYSGNSTIAPYDFVVPTIIDYWGSSSATLVVPTDMYSRNSCNDFAVRVRNNITVTLEFTKSDQTIVKTVALVQGLYQFKITNQDSEYGIRYWSVQ